MNSAPVCDPEVLSSTECLEKSEKQQHFCLELQPSSPDQAGPDTTTPLLDKQV